MRSLFLTFLVLIAALRAQGQAGTGMLKGILTADNGDAIPGCNVSIKGEATSVHTGLCGEFEIDISDKSERALVFSCMASRTWEVPVKRLKDKGRIVIALRGFDRFENGKCDTNYKKEKRIKIK